MVFISRQFAILLLCVFLIVSCKDNWEDHANPESELNSELLAKIKANPDLNKFSEYLVSTGYDQVLVASKSFTVWAPNNTALEGLDENIINDPELLKQFIGNHISYQQYFTQSAISPLHIKMLNGKYLNWSKDNFEGAELISSDQYTRNGVLHVIDSAIAPKKNTWELINNLGESYKQTAFILSLNYKHRVDSLATQTGVDSTGLPTYEEGTGYVDSNKFLERAPGLNDESALNTFIIVTDNVFDTESGDLKPFFSTISNDNDSTSNFASMHLVKDFVIKGLYKFEDLPDTLISINNVKVPIDKSAIIEVQRTSNGIVYIMDKMDFKLKDKFPPIIIEGEAAANVPSNVAYLSNTRYRTGASNNFDRYVSGAAAGFYLRYNLTNLPSGTYKVYWKAVNDILTTAFSQQLIIDKDIPSKTPYDKDFGAKSVGVKDNNEVNVSATIPVEFYQHQKYGSTNLYIKPSGNTILIVDYIKLVPVF